MSRVTYLRALTVFVGGLFAGLVLASSSLELDQTSKKEISERISPVGSVCKTGETCASEGAVTLAADTGSGSARPAETIYNQYCTACHSTGILGAPLKDDAAAWQLKEKEAGGFSNLLSNAINGIRAMPPKGTCMDCSEEEISIAIQYMSGLKP